MKNKFNSPWIAILVGIAAIGFAIFSHFKTDDFIEKSATTTGIVVDVYVKRPSINEKKKGNVEPEYCPIIAFVTESGDSVEFKSSKGSKNFDTYKTGKEVDVMYDPNNPVNARIKVSKESNKMRSLMTGGFGIIIIGVGIFGLFRKKRIAKV